MRILDTASQVKACGALLLGLAVGVGAGCMLPSLERPSDRDDGSPDVYRPDDTGSGGGDTSETDPPPDTGTPEDTGSSGGDDTGGGSGSGGDTGGSDTGPQAPSFSEVKSLLENNCTGCHSSGGGAATRLSFNSSTPSNADYEDVLIPDLVQAGDAANSPLYTRTQPGGGAEMPEGPNGPWSGDATESENTIRDWINAGANIP